MLTSRSGRALPLLDSSPNQGLPGHPPGLFSLPRERERDMTIDEFIPWFVLVGSAAFFGIAFIAIFEVEIKHLIRRILR